MIDQAIIEARKKAAPALKSIIESCDRCTAALNQLENATSQIDAPSHQLLEAIRVGKEQLGSVRVRTKKRFTRFESGLITIAIAGIEKSGKTTLLKTLTGIEDLPTDQSSCTAVPCEIIYDISRKEFDLEFHTSASYAEEILKSLIDGFNNSLAAGELEKKIASLPASCADFAALRLPAASDFIPMTMPRKILDILHNIQTNLSLVRQNLDQHPLQAQPLGKLNEWVAKQIDSVAEAKITTVRRCTIYTEFLGGSPNLRWLDTPGVDDPSPLARERTLRSIDREADLLVVATMPGRNPSPTVAFVDFWTSINRLPNEVRLLDRLQILLNQHTVSDPTGEFILRHRQELEKGGILSALFHGPYQATSPAHMAQFMDGANRHLAGSLPGQDALVVDRLHNDFMSALAGIRTNVFDRARKLHPGDPTQSAVENRMFKRWFLDVKKDGQTEGFWPRMRVGFQTCVEKISEDKRIQDAEAGLQKIFQEKVGALRAQMPNAEQMARFRRENAGDSPITIAMKVAIQGTYSEIINSLSSHVRAFGPIMQRIIINLLRDAGLGNLIVEGEEQKAVASLIARLEETPADETTETVLAGLKDVATLQESLQYVFRYEMRPAVNLFNAMLWSTTKPWEGLANLVAVHGKSSWSDEIKEFFEKNKMPGIQNTDDEHAAFFAEMNKCAVRGIKSVIESGRCRFATIADDVIRDSQYRLTFSDVSQQAWDTLLDPMKSVILAQELSAIRSQSQKLIAFRNAVDDLGKSLANN